MNDSKDVVFIDASSSTSTWGDPPRNTTGFSVNNSSNLNFTRASTALFGDCIELNGGVENVYIENAACRGPVLTDGQSSGITFGSLENDREEGTRDVKNVAVKGILGPAAISPVAFRHYSSKIGAPPAQISNITIDGPIETREIQYAIVFEQCEEGSDAELTDTVFEDYTGRISSYEDYPVGGMIDCPEDGICDVVFENFNMTGREYQPIQILCFDYDKLGLTAQICLK